MKTKKGKEIHTFDTLIQPLDFRNTRYYVTKYMSNNLGMKSYKCLRVILIKKTPRTFSITHYSKPQ